MLHNIMNLTTTCAWGLLKLLLSGSIGAHAPFEPRVACRSFQQWVSLVHMCCGYNEDGACAMKFEIPAVMDSMAQKPVALEPWSP